MTVSELIRQLEKLDPSLPIYCESSLTKDDQTSAIFPIDTIVQCNNFAQLIFKEEWL